MLFFGLQKQANRSDCGLFAIANAVAICNGQSPEFLNYNTNVMRKHLAGLLEDGVFRHFPASKGSVKQTTKRSEVLKVFCTCRLPEKERMIACDNCGEWFHESCLGSMIPPELWSDCSYKWTCELARYCFLMYFALPT